MAPWRRLPFAVILAVLIAGAGGTLAQQPVPAPAAPPAAEVLSNPQIREFLRTARVVRMRGTSKGVTSPRRVTLSDGRLEHDAVFQTIDEQKQIMRFASGKVELDFRDSYHFNIAAYEIAELLGLGHMVPVTIERVIRGERGSLSWWVNWKWDEQSRVKEKQRPPDGLRWRQQWDVARVFRELIDDTDRNQTNMLISGDWHVWMVDFSRAFRRSGEIRSPDSLAYCDRQLLDRLRRLRPEDVQAVAGSHLRPVELEALFQRRDLIVQRFDRLIKERGEERVLFDLLPRPVS